MPTFTITITDLALAGLQAIVARYNADSGTALSVQDWLLLHLKELAIQDNLLAAAQTFQRQAEQSAADAINAERTRLLDTVS
jgi:hypothetical protein